MHPSSQERVAVRLNALPNKDQIINPDHLDNSVSMTDKKTDQFTDVVLACAIAVILTALWLTAAVVLFRGVVPYLWGSASDLGLIGAVLVGAVGIALLLLTGRVFIRIILKALENK